LNRIILCAPDLSGFDFVGIGETEICEQNLRIDAVVAVNGCSQNKTDLRQCL
jgi:hypothetical protein